jgi:hypothetical protein
MGLGGLRVRVRRVRDRVRVRVRVSGRGLYPGDLHVEPLGERCHLVRDRAQAMIRVRVRVRVGVRAGVRVRRAPPPPPPRQAGPRPWCLALTLAPTLALPLALPLAHLCPLGGRDPGHRVPLLVEVRGDRRRLEPGHGR